MAKPGAHGRLRRTPRPGGAESRKPPRARRLPPPRSGSPNGGYFSAKLVTAYFVPASSFAASALVKVAPRFMVIVAVFALKSISTDFTSFTLLKAARTSTGQLLGQVMPEMPTT